MSEITQEEMDKLYGDCEVAISKMKIRLIHKGSTFFASLALSLRMYPSWKVPTAGTNGLTIMFNPKFFLDLTEGEQNFLLLHEVMHVVFDHLDRFAKLSDVGGGKHSAMVWNMAGDYVINQELLTFESGSEFHLEMPKGGLVDKKYAGMSTDAVYKQLLESVDEAEEFSCDLMEAGAGEDGVEGENPSNLSGTDQDNPTGSPKKTQEEVSQEIKDMVTRAATESRMSQEYGNLPGSLQRVIEVINKPKLSYKSLLRSWVSSFGMDDYTWKLPDRRFNDFYLPSMHSETIGEIAIAVDTSGSVSPEQLTQFASEVHAIMAELLPTKVSLIAFDTSITNVEVINSPNQIKNFEWLGGGGTDLNPVMELAIKEKPKVLVVFSDMYCDHNVPVPTDTEVLFVVVDNPNSPVPFGKRVDFSTT